MLCNLCFQFIAYKMLLAFLTGLVATSGGEGDSQLLLWNVLRGELAADINVNVRYENFHLCFLTAALEYLSISLNVVIFIENFKFKQMLC